MNSVRKVFLIALLVASVGLVGPSQAFAQASGNQQYQQATSAIFDLRVTTNQFIADIIQNGQGIAKFADVLFVFFVSLLIFRMVIAYMFYELSYSQALRTVFAIAIVKFFMLEVTINGQVVNAYLGFCDALFKAGSDVAGEVQEKILGVNAQNPMAPIDFILALVLGIMDTNFNAGCGGIGCIAANIGRLLFYMFFIMPVLLFAALLAVISFYWSMWAVALLKFIGYMFIPFLLFQPLQKLFDGWFETYLSYVIYMVLVRINICLMAFVMARLMFPGNNVQQVITGNLSATPPAGMGLMDWLGMLLIAGVSILALIKTDDLAGGIVGGASGIGNTVSKMAT